MAHYGGVVVVVAVKIAATAPHLSANLKLYNFFQYANDGKGWPPAQMSTNQEIREEQYVRGQEEGGMFSYHSMCRFYSSYVSFISK